MSCASRRVLNWSTAAAGPSSFSLSLAPASQPLLACGLRGGVQEPLHLDLRHQTSQSPPRPLLQPGGPPCSRTPSSRCTGTGLRHMPPGAARAATSRQLGRGNVAPAGSQRAADTGCGRNSEDLGLSTEVQEKAPEPGTAHLGLRALQSQHWSWGAPGRAPHRAPRPNQSRTTLTSPKGHL